jgi:hypothetical protein
MSGLRSLAFGVLQTPRTARCDRLIAAASVELPSALAAAGQHRPDVVGGQNLRCSTGAIRGRVLRQQHERQSAMATPAAGVPSAIEIDSRGN